MSSSADTEEHGVCSCNQLEAEALLTNEQILGFEVRSKDIKWEEHVVPLQTRAAPVYLQRQFGLISNYREPIGNHNRREVFVCHDMMGNYLEDRHYNCSKKFDDYRFYHWAGIDYFCYFSHKYCSIPPCGWLNAAHRHGVRVLGTMIVENSGGSRLLHEILESRDMANSIVQALVKLCKHYQFEGWLVNIECTVKPEAMENLRYFLQRLKDCVVAEVPDGCVFWYDSIIDSGELLWQNEINEKNVQFFRASSAMLINYTWNDSSLEKTLSICEEEVRPSHTGEHQRREQERAPCQERVFFGIDVFGRGQMAKFQSRQTLARIAKKRFSVGIFAPAWTYETLQTFGYDIRKPEGDVDTNEAFLARNDKFWWSLWEHLATHPYHHLPFYTDFCLGSGQQTYERGSAVPGKSAFFNLSRQALQPSVPLHGQAERSYAHAYNGGSSLRVVQYDTSFRLFASDFQLRQGGLVVSYAYKLDRERDGEFDCILRLCTGNNARDCYVFLGDYYDSVSLQKGRCYLSPFKAAEHPQLLRDNGLESSQIPAGETASANGWKVRYYVIAFDGPVQVKDVGVLWRRKADTAQDSAYLGALHLNGFDVNAADLPNDANVALIQIYGWDLVN